MADFDPFILFRALLFVFLTIYTVLMLASTGWRIYDLFTGDDPGKQMLRLYVSYHLLTIRLRPVRDELFQIAGWLLLLLGVWWMHTLI